MGGLATPLPALAQDTVSSPGLGPWLFASVALVLVGGLAWQLGRQAGRRDAAPQDNSAPAVEPVRPPAPTPVETDPTARSPATRPSAAGRAGSPVAAAESPADEDAAAFSYALSHDLRAPLRVVDGFARILKEDYGRQLDRIGNDHLDRLMGAAARMNGMIDAMLSMAQLNTQPLAKQPVDLSEIAHAVIADLRRQWPERHITVDITPGLQAMGDPLLLRQVLDNLLGNAWKYSAKNPAARLWFRSLRHDGCTYYEVGDNGAGFDMRASQRLFGLFQRLHPQSEFPGTGIGLASVRQIVRRHGGEVRAESAPGKGARFFFTLPG